ncbi:glycosyltransferase [methane-oxidizing endosymbiont of Gigantopelta aegis]|uniref:glycosyltransferase n=1 Tax=methane-oxidizing endosymbiont of Gigantopelta aegis TaxID=2794938 RepID=UPI001FDA3B21|nr:glycosyltransferase [methane-oxidizing endosymbiont of Gigantopelta aegis]
MGGYLSVLAGVVWLITLLLPWQPWRNREVLEAETDFSDFDLHDVTVLIPARNEAEVIAGTLQSLKQQGRGLQVVLVDDDSNDETVNIARTTGLENLTIIESKSLPPGWTGKLWAQEQGLKVVKTPLLLLLDADIALKPGMLKALKQKQQKNSLQFVSLMAVLRFQSFWEKLLMPAFIYFFKMIYPFALANNPKSKMAAAAGGCIFLETAVLKDIGGMAVIKDAVIDDCTLAKTIKSKGYKIWVGLTHGVISQRPYVGLSEIWQMVARTAYTQLHYSRILLLLCTMIMLLMYWWPLMAVFWVETPIELFINGLSLSIMISLYLPTLFFYRLSPLWALTMPIVAALYLMMTWTSAIRYWRGERSRWKGRRYLTGQN